MDQPLRTDAQAVCRQPDQTILTASADKAAVAARFDKLVEADPLLKVVKVGVTKYSAVREKRKQDLNDIIHQAALERMWAINQVRSVQAKASRWRIRAQSARRQLKRMDRRRTKKQAAAERVIKRRKAFLKKIAVAQVALERMKEFKRNLKL